jgi:hypothetical protein
MSSRETSKVAFYRTLSQLNEKFFVILHSINYELK